MAAKKTSGKSKRHARKGQHGRARALVAAAKSARRQSAASRRASSPETIKRAGKLFEDLVKLMMRLRGPGGCPWDREQTHSTLRTYLLEETYEVLAALDNNDDRELAEELGDLLLQVIFHAEIARESGRFDVTNVISGIHDKMVRRHPHVFGDVEARTSAQVLKNWEQLKRQEKAGRGVRDSADAAPPALLAEVPRNLPALLEGYQLTRRAAKVGFDWGNVEGIFDKLREETLELQQALTTSDADHHEEEIGDLLFVLVNLSRYLKFDPEVALKRANRKFKSRFNSMESMAAEAGETLAQMSQEKLEVLWEAAKAGLAKSGAAKNRP